MNKREAASVLAMIAGAFPGTELGADNIQVWYQSVLHDLDAAEGMEIAQQLISNPDRQMPHSFPKLSEFQELRRVRARVKTQDSQRRARALESPVVAPATAKANIAALRAKLGKESGPLKTMNPHETTPNEADRRQRKDP